MPGAPGPARDGAARASPIVRYLLNIADEIGRLKDHNMYPVSINSGNAQSHKRFKDKHSYPFPLLVDAGKACDEFQGLHLRNLQCRRVQVDEIWAFCYAKARNVETAKAAPEDAGDVWTWVAIDADTKLVPCRAIGDRSAATAKPFIADLARRLVTRIQLTSDGLKSYVQAVDDAFGADVDYAQLIKIYGDTPSQGRYSPGVCLGAEKEARTGSPDPDHISTSFVERGNLTMRCICADSLVARVADSDMSPCRTATRGGK